MRFFALIQEKRHDVRLLSANYDRNRQFVQEIVRIFVRLAFHIVEKHLEIHFTFWYYDLTKRKGKQALFPNFPVKNAEEGE